MQWKGRRESENVEDRRTLTPSRVAAGGGAGILVLALLTYLLGGDPQEVLKLLQNNPQQAAPQGAPAPNPAQDELKRFVSVVLADTEDVWREQFRKMGKVYQEPHLVLFTGRVDSGAAQPMRPSGRFTARGTRRSTSTCSFCDELKDRIRAPGDFAEAYVIAHEVGHHVQSLLGITDQVNAQRRADQGGGQRAVGPAGAPGRFPGGILGEPRPEDETDSRARRPEGGAAAPPMRLATTACRNRPGAT